MKGVVKQPVEVVGKNYKETFKKSPNCSGVLKPEGIILHHSAGSWAGLVPWCLNPSAKVSYHCAVAPNGERTILVPDNMKAWHAGRSSFRGRSGCNNFMLGIAVSGDTNKRELSEDEINSVAQWCARKMKAYNFGIDQITTHREVSPSRKTDVDIRAEKAIKERILAVM